jgi:class 3 adenylate cyclase/tetratricopeptide (TPR) repeat protein
LARKVVSVLFCDVVGSTSAGAQLDPEEVGDVLRVYHRAARSIIERHGGVVEKFVGDGVFAVFGFPMVHEDDGERSVRAALAICAAAADLPGLGQDALQVRCGVTTGEVLVQLDSDPAAGEGFIVGPAANLAGRLQALAPIDGVVVDSQTYRLTERVFEYVVLEPTTVKGIDEPLEVFQPRAPLVAVRAALRPELTAQLIGRQEELRELTAAYTDVLATGRSTLVTVIGEPGLGKSRLVSALQERLLGTDPVPVWRIGRSLPYGEGIGAWAFAEILKSHVGILESDDAATALARLDVSLPYVPYRDWLRKRLLPILGLGSPAVGEWEEVLVAYRRFIELLAQERPAVVVFEDIHWADDAVLAFLAELADQPAAVPLLVIGTTRPELLERGGAAEGLGTGAVHLAPLPDADIANLAASVLADGSLAPEVERAILQSAGGNPLYAGEFVRLLLDRGALVQDGGVLRLAEGETLAVPESTQALIAARVDVLPPTERSVLGDAAIVGGTFWAGALAAVGNRPVGVVLDALEDLGRRHYVEFVPGSTLAGEVEATFTHGLVRDAVYAQLTRRDRVEKHERVARWLELAAADRVDLVDTLAYHTWTAVELQPRRNGAPEALRSLALRYATLAAERNVALDVRSATLHLGRAISLSEEDGAQHTNLLALRGQLALHEGHPEEAVDLLEQAVGAWREAGDVRAAARRISSLGHAYQQLGSPRGFELAEETVALLEDEPASPELLDALSLCVAARTLSGQPRAAIQSAERAFAVAEELGVDRPTMALEFYGIARFHSGYIDGIDDLREAASLAISRGEGRDAATNQVNLLIFEHLVRGPFAALEIYESVLEFSQQRGLSEMIDLSRVFALEPMLDVGRIDQLLALASEVEQRLVAAGNDFGLIYTRSALLRTWTHLGQPARIEATAAWLEAAARKTGAVEDFVAGLAASAIGRAAIGQVDAACALIEELLAGNADSVWSLAPRFPALVRAAAGAGDVALLRRTIDFMSHPSPYAQAAVVAARGVLTELEGDPAAAATAFLDGADRFERLSVPLERWTALCGAERSLLAAGDNKGAADAAVAARAVRAEMPAGEQLADAASQLVAYGASSAPTK